MLALELRETHTRPAVIHAHGLLPHKPHWRPIRDAYFATAPLCLPPPRDLTIVTCNNGHQAMGCFEKSLAHMGLEPQVLGGGLFPWSNSRHKPRLLAEAARRCPTEYMLYADSRDAIIVQPPEAVLERFIRLGAGELLFGADVLSHPPCPRFQSYEHALAGRGPSAFRYLNAGAWIGRTRFVADFFALAAACPPLPEAPESEQGILRQLLPFFPGRVRIDYDRSIFLNVGFIISREPLFTDPALTPGHRRESGTD